MGDTCLFCGIISGSIPAERLYEDKDCVAISDIAPKAPVHLLVLPREHFSSTQEMNAAHEPLVGHLVHVAAQLARDRGLQGQGYRLVFNHGSHAGQTVQHLHLHLLGGRNLRGMG
jgi:diadenosine tetraphosphate (Ap4A) HIT family hydrolase